MFNYRSNFGPFYIRFRCKGKDKKKSVPNSWNASRNKKQKVGAKAETFGIKLSAQQKPLSAF